MIMEETEKEKKGYFTNKRMEMIPFVPAGCKKILEIGCSEGFFGQILKKERQAEVWGVEIEKSAALRAKENLDFALQGDFFDVESELPENYFDCAVLNDVIEHFTDPWLLLARVKSHLTSGGYIVSSIPNVRYIGNLMELLIKKDWEYKSDGILDKTHYRFFTEKSIRSLFKSSGFTVIRLQGVNPTHSFKVKLLSWATFGFFKDTRYLEFAVVARLL